MAALFKNVTFDIYPLFAAMAAGTGAAIYFGSKVMMSPDVCFDANRRNSITDVVTSEQGEQYHEHGLRHMSRSQQFLVFPNLNAKVGGAGRPRVDPAQMEFSEKKAASQ
jgi:hypothetical protein